MTKGDIIYLSPPEPVNMGNAWFSIASINHFWIRRRLQVLRRLTPMFDWAKLRLADIGGGSGLLQRQLEDEYGATVDGFDLNELALKSSVCRTSRRFCYNIFNRDDALREVYDAIFLFDVIEHVPDDRAFLEAALFHLRRGGHVLINVPADPALFSAYDRAAGHMRRYLARDLLALVAACGLEVVRWTYWGWSLRLLLHIRRRRLRGQTDDDQILRDGFDMRNGVINAGLWLFSQLERIPQHHAGSSLMLVARLPQ
jgi:2-polyprenyl-3-methyl-5-hydroxy-6-metoxy-1,4-benzoquinol methylase